MKNRITWLGHASLRIEGEKRIYVDPWKLKGPQPPADIVLVTHSHFDHCSPPDVAKVTTEETEILCAKDCVAELGTRAKAMRPGEKRTVKGVEIQGVPAYNLAKKFHPKANGWLGYVVVMGGESIYVAGDTDRIPEMEQLKGITVALLPVGGTYTMSAGEAAEAANKIAPEVAVPIHYGDVVGSEEDARTFQKRCKVRTELLR